MSEYRSNLNVSEIGQALKSALEQKMIREEDTAVIFYDLAFLEERLQQLVLSFPSSTLP